MQGTLDLVGTIAVVVATVAIAFFTGLVWLLNRRQHQLSYEASLRVIEKQAQFRASTKEVRVELVLNNTSLVPAILHEWSVLVRDGDFQESIADGNLEQTLSSSVFRVLLEAGGGRLSAGAPQLSP